MLEIGKIIGRGSFADVHRGTFHGLDVALKILHAKSLEQSEAMDEFKREAMLLCRRSMLHPNILLTFGGTCFRSTFQKFCALDCPTRPQPRFVASP